MENQNQNQPLTGPVVVAPNQPLNGAVGYGQTQQQSSISEQLPASNTLISSLPIDVAPSALQPVPTQSNTTLSAITPVQAPPETNEVLSGQESLELPDSTILPGANVQSTANQVPAALPIAEKPPVTSSLFAQNPSQEVDGLQQSQPTPVATAVIDPDKPHKRRVNRALAFISAGALAIVLLIAGISFIISRRNSAQLQNPSDNVAEQDLLGGEAAENQLEVLNLTGTNRKLVVNGDLITRGALYIGSDSSTFFGQLNASELTADREYILPDESGTIALQENVVSSLNGSVGDITLGGGLTITNNTLTNSLVIQGTDDQIIVNSSGDTITLSTPQDIGITSSPEFAGITLTSAGIQNGNEICDVSNNCGYAGGTDAFIQDGNSFGETAVLGTNDANSLEFEVGGSTIATIDITGGVGIGNYGTLDASLEVNEVDASLAGSLGYTSIGIAATSLTSDGLAIYGISEDSTAIFGYSNATSPSGILEGAGILGVNLNTGGAGVVGLGGLFGGTDGIGVYGLGGSYGVYATSTDTYGLLVEGNCSGLFGCSVNPETLAVFRQYNDVTTNDFFEAQNQSGETMFSIAYNGNTSIGFGATQDSVLTVVGAPESAVYGAGVDVDITDTTTANGLTSATKSKITASPSVASSQQYMGMMGWATSASDNLEFGYLEGLGGIAEYTGTGTLGVATGMTAQNVNSSTGTIDYSYGLRLLDVINSGGGTVVNNYGIEVGSFVTGTNNYGIAIGEAGTQTLWLQGDGGTSSSGIGFGSSRDANLYRSAAGELTTDDDLVVGSQLAVGSPASITANTVAVFAEAYTNTAGAQMGTATSVILDPSGASSAVTYGGYNDVSVLAGNAQNLTGYNIGLGGSVTHNGTGTMTYGFGAGGTVVNTSSGDITIAYGHTGAVQNTGSGDITFIGAGLTGLVVNSGSGTIANGAGLFVSSASNTGGGTITNNYGINVQGQTAGASDYGIRIDAADTQTLWIGGAADSTTAAAGIGFGASRDTNLYRSAANTLKTDDAFSVGTLGATDTAAYLCLNSSNILAACSGTATGSAFVQGGNSFGGEAILGTNDANDLSFETSATTRMTISATDSHIGLGNGNGAAYDDCTLLAVGTCENVISLQEDFDDLSTGYVSGIANHMLLSTTANSGNQTTAIQNFIDIESGNAFDFGTLRGSWNQIDHNGTGTIGVADPSRSVVNNNSTGDLTITTAHAGAIFNWSTGDIGTAVGSDGAVVNLAGGTITNATGVKALALNGGAGSITTAKGLDVAAGITGAGSITTNYGIDVVTAATAGTITNNYAINVQSATGGGTITTNYGINVGAQTAGGSDYGVAIGAADTQTLWLSSNADNTTAAAGIAFGSSLDTNLYRGASGQLNTDGDLDVASQMALGSTASITAGTTLGVSETTTATVGNVYGINTDIDVDAGAASSATVYGYRGSVSIESGNIQDYSGGVIGVSSAVSHDGTGTLSNLVALGGESNITSSGDVTSASGTYGVIAHSGSGTVTDANGLATIVYLTGGGDITNAYGVHVLSLLDVGAGSIGTSIGLKIDGQSGGVTSYGVVIDEATTQSLWLRGDGGTANTGIGFGLTNDTNLYRSAADVLRTDDVLSIGTLGTTDNVSYLCLNASSQVANCSGTATGSAFVQGGNSFAATATLGTNDANSLVFETNNQAAATIASGGATTFQNNTDTTSGFRVLDADGGTAVLAVDTTNEFVAVGGAPANGILTVGTDTTTAAGGQYFGTDTNLYRGAANFLYTDDSLRIGANQSFLKEVAHTITVEQSTTASTAGAALSIAAGAGSADTSGVGGALNLTGGAGVAGNSGGGAVNIVGGAGVGVSTGGGVNITGGADLTGGNVTINAGSGVSDGNIRLATTDGMVNVGSTSTPTAMLHVRARISATTTLEVDNLTNTGAIAQFKDNGTVVASLADGGAALFQNVADTTTGFKVMDADGGTSVLDVDTTNERVGIGTDAPGYKLEVAENLASGYVANFFNDGNDANRYGLRVQAGADDASGTTYYLDAYDGDGGQVGYIANTTGTFALTDISDARTKTNINDTSADASTILNDLRVVDFNRIQNPDGPLITGFIAQEVQDVYSQAVTTSSTGLLGVSKDAFIPILVKGHQNQQGEIGGLEGRVNDLELQLSSLSAQQGGSPSQSNNDFASLNVSGEATIKTLTVTGSASIAGNLAVGGDAKFDGDITVAGHIIGNEDTRGTITIPAGETELEHTFATPYKIGTEPIVILTATNAFAPNYRVESDEDGFTVFFQTAASANVKLNYQIQQ